MKNKWRKENHPRKRSIAWLVFMALFVWGGYELAILWHNISPESFPTEKRWLVKFAGGEIGATTYLLLISFFRRKIKRSEKND